jgi:hypothetical protein
MYPTPYRWTADNGQTHVFYDSHQPPGVGFGWSSLCEELELPIEEEHFELDEEATESSITCRRCRERLDRSSVKPSDEEIAALRGCLIEVRRDEQGDIDHARRLCRGGPLHYDIPFEPESFTGDLHERVDDVCEECWQRYVANQWSGNVEGGQLQVDVWTDKGEKTYYAASAEAINTGPKAMLRLTSENGLKREVPREEIGSITLTPAQIVDY